MLRKTPLKRSTKPIARKTPLKRSTKPIARSPLKKCSTINSKKEIVRKVNVPRETKSVTVLLKEATKFYNAWIRKRDGNKCISCGEVVDVALIQAGHFMPSTYSSLRFHDWNVNSECEKCNCYDKNHLIGYRKNLIEKIGIENVEWLESTPLAKNFKWERADLIWVIENYK